MATRLTGFSKFLMTLLIVGLIGGGLWYLANKTDVGKDLVNSSQNDSSDNSSNSATKNKNRNSSKSDNVIDIGVVTWGGYAGGQYFNEGFDANEQSRFFKDYGFKVNFKVLDDPVASRAAWKADEVDLLWATIDALPAEMEGLQEFDPQVVFQADWSRGGDAVVARRGINKVSDLKGKKVAVALYSPSHSFLLWLLDAGGLSHKDVEIVEAPSAVDAASYFKAGQVDAAVVWSPDDEDCIKTVKGSKVLKNTKDASHIIADVFIAKKKYINANKEKLQQLYEGWMKGAAEINGSDAKKRKAAKILASGLNQPESFCYNAINNVRLCTAGDNANFFNVDRSFDGVTGENLYTNMSQKYRDVGVIKGNIPNWRSVSNPGIVQAVNFTGKEHLAENAPKFTKPTKELETKPAFSSKPVTIVFPSGSSTMDDNAKIIIDREFIEIAKSFGNARIRIEGNTDNTGSRSLNLTLSKKRAQSVASYLINEHGMDPNRFVIVGNGPDKPVADNKSAKGKAQNRRTDFQLLSGE